MRVATSRLRNRLPIALISAAAVVAATAAPAAISSGHQPASGSKTPAIGVHPHFINAGSPVETADGPVFSCQKTVPAGCYGPQHLPAASLQQIAPDGLTPFDPASANQVGWSGEITLDVEWAHAIAPAATIKLVLAKSNDDADILSATRYAVSNNLGDVISQSFGEAEQCMLPTLVQQQNALFAQAVKERITLLASSGDQGAAQPTCDGSAYFKAASTPASDPNVTGVGGTRLVADGLTGAYQSESVWNEPQFEAGGGGGFSVLYRAPSYQRGDHLSSRGVPDIAYNAAIIGGALTVWTRGGSQGVFRFGGTSAGSPQWAGLVALANQLRQGRVGALNP